MPTRPTIVFRPAELTDLESIYQLAQDSGIGITTLPKNRTVLEQRLSLSVDSFRAKQSSPGHEYYLFVLEDTRNHHVVGTSAIKASIGHSLPSFAYTVIHRTRTHFDLNIQCKNNWLVLNNELNGKSELCTLYLKPDYRHSHIGVFLSRARFLMIAQHRTRFEPCIIAEMRGVADEEGNSPFWDSLGHHFFQMSFEKADALTLSTNKQFIMDLIPEQPIPICLLSETAQAAIGQPHITTKPAMQILLKEGFQYHNMVDIFDAGPIIQAQTSDIHTIQHSVTSTVVKIEQTLDPSRYMISTTESHFRATMGPLRINPEGVCIDQQTADILQIKTGDRVCFSL